MFRYSVWFFEKKLGLRQPLTDVIVEGDEINFEATQNASVGNNSSGNGIADGKMNLDNSNESNAYCSWFASIVWKGKKPDVERDPGIVLQQLRSCNGVDAKLQGQGQHQINGHFEGLNCYNGRVSETLVKGVGVIAKVLNDKNGVIWWLKSSNHLQSVWFESKQTFLYGVNLADKSLLEIFKEGDPVTFLAEKAPHQDFPTKWVAKQVLIADKTANVICRVIQDNGGDPVIRVSPAPTPAISR